MTPTHHDPPRRGDVVEVEWEDSEAIHIGWRPVTEYLEAADHRHSYRTAGYWIAGSTRVVIALSMDPFNSNVSHVMSIPRKQVSVITVLGRSNKRVRRALAK